MKIQKLGMRTFKTGLAITITALIMKYVFLETPFFACIGALVAVERTTKRSINAIINRNLGTIIGGAVGALAILISDNTIFLGFGIMAVIYVLVTLGRKDSIIAGCIVYLAIVFLNTQDTAHIYAIRRISETLFGSFIGIVINLVVRTPDFEESN